MPQLDTASRTALLVSLVPVLVTGGGATLAAWRPPGPRLRSAIQHLAAGVVFSVVAVELLPGVTRVHDRLEVGWTFAAGLVCMLLVDALGERLGGEAEGNGVSVGQLVAIGLDVLLDGILVGIAFAGGARVGLLLTAALCLELLSLGLATASSLAAAGASRERTVLVPTGLSLLLVVGAAAGGALLGGASEHTMAGVLAFGCAALLYLVTEELLVEAHREPDTRFATTMFFVGFLAFLLIGMSE